VSESALTSRMNCYEDKSEHVSHSAIYLPRCNQYAYFAGFLYYEPLEAAKQAKEDFLKKQEHENDESKEEPE